MGSPNRKNDAAPLYATQRSNRETLGGEVAQVLSACSKVPMQAMPWQRDALDIFCEIDPRTGLFWYRKCILIVPRQAGKTTLTRGKLTHRALTTAGANMIYTAQDRNMARRRLEKTIYLPLKASPLGPTLSKPNWQNGQEAVRWRNGSELIIISNQPTSGHGDTLDEAHIDEAFAHRDSRVEQNISPTMITVPGAQQFITSAAGDSNSHFLASKLEMGRALARANDPTSRTAYIEYSAPLDADRSDPWTWMMCHPALNYTIQIEDLQAEHDDLDEDEFNRAYMGWWPVAEAHELVIPRASWQANFIDPSQPSWTGVPMWAVDVSPDRAWASIGLAAKSYDGEARAFMEVIDHEEGTAWVVARLVNLASRFGGRKVAIDGSGSASALDKDLTDAGFDVVRLSARERADACGGLYDDAIQGKVHYLDDPTLNDALTSASKVNVYGGEAWIFSRGKSRADITPLYAATLARYAYVKYGTYDPLLSIA